MTPSYATVVFTIVVLAWSAMLSGQPPAQASPAIDDPEAYAVYAAELSRTSHIAVGKPLTNIAILQETALGDMDCPREGSIEPEWRSVVADYRTKNARTRIIRQGFDLGIRYSVVPLAELRKLMEEAGYLSPLSPLTNHAGAKVFARFPGGRLYALSAVGFNAEKTRAMVALQIDCFPSREPLTVCHAGEQRTMVKKDGRWTTTPAGPGCVWIA